MTDIGYENIKRKLELAREFYKKSISNSRELIEEEYLPLAIPVNFLAYSSILFTYSYENREKKIVFDAGVYKDFIPNICSFAAKLKSAFEPGGNVRGMEDFKVEIKNKEQLEFFSEEDLKDAILLIYKIGNAIRHSNYEITFDESGECIIEIENEEKDGTMLHFSMKAKSFFLEFYDFNINLKNFVSIKKEQKGINEKEITTWHKNYIDDFNFLNAVFNEVDSLGAFNEDFLTYIVDNVDSKERNFKSNDHIDLAIKKLNLYADVPLSCYKSLVYLSNLEIPEKDKVSLISRVMSSLKGLFKDTSLAGLYIYLNSFYSLYDWMEENDNDIYCELPFIKHYDKFKFHGDKSVELNNKIKKMSNLIHAQNKYKIEKLGLKGIEKVLDELEGNISYINKEIMNRMRNSIMHVRVKRTPDGRVRLSDKTNKGNGISFECEMEERELASMTYEAEFSLDKNNQKSLIERLERCRDQLSGVMDEETLKMFDEYIEEVKKYISIR